MGQQTFKKGNLIVFFILLFYTVSSYLLTFRDSFFESIMVKYIEKKKREGQTRCRRNQMKKRKMHAKIEQKIDFN